MTSNAKSTIELVFEGVDKTAAATQAALSNVSQFSIGVQSATQPIADFTTSAVKLEAGLLAAGLAITAFSVKVAGDFDTAFREVSTLIDAPIQDLEEFKGAILSYASTSTKPLEEVTQSIYNAISAGVDFSDSIEAVSVAEQLSVAGKADLNEALLVLVSSLNAYGVGMEEAGRFSDALFQTVKSGQTTLPELAASLSNVTGLAATAGVDFEELLAAIATLTATGTPTSQAVTQIQGAIAAVIKPTSQASALAKELGIQFNASRLQAVGLTGVLDDVKTATGGNAEQMAVLFGRVEALNGVLTLTGLGAETFADNLQAMASSAGSVDEAFAIMVQSVDVSAQRVRNALETLFISIGAPLLDEFDGVAQAIAGIFKAVGEAARSENSGIADLVKYIESQFGGLQETLETVAANLPAALEQADFSGFMQGLEAVSGSVAGLFENIDLTSAKGLADAITIVGEGFNALSQFTGGVIDSLKPLFDQITKVGGGLKEINPEFFEAAGQLAGFVTQANALSGALANMLPLIQGLVAAMGASQAAGLAGAIANVSGGLGKPGGLLALLGNAGLLGVAGGAAFGIGTLANKMTELATGTSISTKFTDLAISMGLVDDEATRIIDSINDVPGELKSLGSSADDSAQSVSSLAETLEAAGHSVGVIRPLPDIVSETSKVMNEATEVTKAFAEAGELITVDEKLALIEGQTQVTIAEIEAGAKVMTSAFESVNTAIDSTGDTLTGLFGLMGNENISKFDKLDLSKEIKKESERRDRSFDIQEKALRSLLKTEKAKRERLDKKGALITVNGDGLQPHLEGFMFEILKSLQVRINAEGYEMLLGV